MVAVAVTRTDWSVADLRSAAKRATSTKQGLRLLAIAMVLDGYSREAAAEACGMDRQTLRDWVHRYNEAGIDGLTDRTRSGRPTCLNKIEQAEVAGWVEQGADLAKDGVVRFRRVDLRDRVAGRFGVYLHEGSIGKLLRGLGYRRLSVRPLHPKADLAAQESFKENFASLAREALGDRATGKPVEVWFQDEARVGQQGTLTRIWAKRGTRPRALRDRRFNWAYLFGAICPARGVGSAVVLPTVNIDAMNQHLAAISPCVSEGAIALMIIDGAGWHRSPKLIIPDNIVLLKLPPYAPELNSAENIWAYLRGNAFGHQVWENYNAILDACCTAWTALMSKPDVVRSVGTRAWAEVKT